jgi:hypothetical protein
VGCLPGPEGVRGGEGRASSLASTRRERDPSRCWSFQVFCPPSMCSRNGAHSVSFHITQRMGGQGDVDGVDGVLLRVAGGVSPPEWGPGSDGGALSGECLDPRDRASLGSISIAQRGRDHLPTAHDSRSAACGCGLGALLEERFRIEVPGVESAGAAGGIGDEVVLKPRGITDDDDAAKWSRRLSSLRPMRRGGRTVSWPSL